MKETLTLYISLVFLFAGNSMFTQRELKKANRAFENLQYDKAITYYGKAYEKRKSKESILGLAKSYDRIHQYKKSYESYKKAADNNYLDNDTRIDYATVLYTIGNYGELNEQLTYLKKKRVSSDRITTLYTSLNEKERMLKDSVYFKVSPFIVDKTYANYGAVLFEDGIIYVSNNPKSKGDKNETYTGGLYFDLFYNTPFKSSSLGSSINSDFHESSAFFLKKDSLLYFTRSELTKDKKLVKNGDNENQLQIYISHLNQKGVWEKPKAFKYSTMAYSIGHPTLTKDGKTMFFISDKEGGYGKTDIYVTTFENNDWTEPKNIGDSINTGGNEMFPSIFEDENGVVTLYFSSDARVGLGGLDVYSSVFKDGSFARPIHLTYPLNTAADDFGIVFETSKSGYISSNRNSEDMVDGIYVFEYVKQQFFVQGIVKDQNNKAIPNARVTVYDEKKQLLYQANSDENGYYAIELAPNAGNNLVVSQEGYVDNTFSVSTLNKTIGDTVTKNIQLNNLPAFYAKVILKDKQTGLSIPSGVVSVLQNNKSTNYAANSSGEKLVNLEENQEYVIVAKANGYFMGRGQVSTKNKEKGDTVVLVFDLEKLEVNKAIRLENIYYDLGKWNIREDAKASLNDLIETLKDNPTITIELSSHTDSRGDTKSNQTLSQKRATSAINYLVENGIDKNRLTAVGYGESKLLNKCSNGVKCSETEHQFNRRTEFKVLGQ